MRPLPGNGASPVSSDPLTNASPTTTSASSHMTFILTDEASMDATSYSMASDMPDTLPKSLRKTVYPPTGNDSSSDLSESPHSPLSAGDVKPSSPIPRFSISQAGLASEVLISPTTETLACASGPGSPVSCRDSLAASFSEGHGSLTLSTLDGSTPEDAASRSGQDQHITVEDQLVMPTISVPSRRPFTVEGKSIGRLRLLVAGRSGLGKTSLIQAIVRSCQHIIHVDPAVPAFGMNPQQRHDLTVDQGPGQRHSRVTTEIFASTKPYPTWWNPPQFPCNRRRSAGDAILDRNICFVDTPGFDVTSQATGIGQDISQYIERHLQKSALRGLDDVEALSTLSNGGGLLVDAILYMMPSTGITRAEMTLLQRLSSLTSIIPVLAQADHLEIGHIESSKTLIHNQLIEEEIPIFTFEMDTSVPTAHLVYAVSSKAGDDRNIMDASLLMSSEYTPLPVQTDLTALVDRLFSPEGSHQLRHATATKLLAWRRMNHPERISTAFDHEMIMIQPRRIGPHIDRLFQHGRDQDAGRWAGVHVVSWAADLQRSLLNERTPYYERPLLQHLKRSSGEANTWPTRSQTLTLHGEPGGKPGGTPLDASSHRRKYLCNDSTWRGTLQQDPLGLLELGTRLKRTSWHAIELFGGAGVVGGMAVWMLW